MFKSSSILLATAIIAVPVTSATAASLTVDSGRGVTSKTVSAWDPSSSNVDGNSSSSTGSFAYNASSQEQGSGFYRIAVGEMNSYVGDTFTDPSLCSGTGRAYAAVHDLWEDASVAYGNSLLTVEFTTEIPITWSLDYTLAADSGEAAGGWAMTQIDFRHADLTPIHSAGGTATSDDPMTSVSESGVLSGTLPPGSYRLDLKAVASINDQYDTEFFGLIGAEATWSVDFKIESGPDRNLNRKRWVPKWRWIPDIDWGFKDRYRRNVGDNRTRSMALLDEIEQSIDEYDRSRSDQRSGRGEARQNRSKSQQRRSR